MAEMCFHQLLEDKKSLAQFSQSLEPITKQMFFQAWLLKVDK
jgi:hypothetical protein